MRRLSDDGGAISAAGGLDPSFSDWNPVDRADHAWFWRAPNEFDFSPDRGGRKACVAGACIARIGVGRIAGKARSRRVVVKSDESMRRKVETLENDACEGIYDEAEPSTAPVDHVGKIDWSVLNERRAQRIAVFQKTTIHQNGGSRRAWNVRRGVSRRIEAQRRLRARRFAGRPAREKRDSERGDDQDVTAKGHRLASGR